MYNECGLTKTKAESESNSNSVNPSDSGFEKNCRNPKTFGFGLELHQKSSLNLGHSNTTFTEHSLITHLILW